MRQLLLGWLDTDWQALPPVPSLGNTSSNTSAPLLVGELCRFTQNVVQHDAVGSRFHSGYSSGQGAPRRALPFLLRV